MRALTTLTLAAGFASAIFAPLTAALAGQLNWRGAYLVLATILRRPWSATTEDLARYASLNGAFSDPLTAATAIAPTVGAALATQAGGYLALFLILAVTGAATPSWPWRRGAPQSAAGMPPAPSVPADQACPRP